MKRTLLEVFCGLAALVLMVSFHHQITRIETRGKAMLTWLEGGYILYSHNQLYGRWYVERRGKTPRTSRSLRVALHGPEKSAYLFSATDVSIWQEDELESTPTYLLC